MIFAQALGPACQVAFGQLLKLFIYFLPLLVGENAIHPKHNSHLHFQRQHVAKRFVLGIDQPSAVHVDSAKHEMGPHHSVPLIHLFFEPITHSRQDLGPQPKKCTHGGHPLESPLVFKFPHVRSLHQSAPLMESLNHVARSVWVHSSLFSHTVSRWWVRSSQLFCTPCQSPYCLTC